MQRLGKSALVFVAIGLAIYAAVYCVAEQLVYRTGKSNPFFKIAVAEQVEFDWIILGASHAMPLDFADFNSHIERETRLRVINLASPGTGPLYNRFVFEHFLRKRRAHNVLYILDSFAFYAKDWNEDRFSDPKLLRRTPFEFALAEHLFRYVRSEGVDPRAGLDYVTGFSKINNRERLEPDIWEGEKQFDRVHRPSSVATRRRIEYLYPNGTSATSRSRYLGELVALADLARSQQLPLVVMTMPVPLLFRQSQPQDPIFEAELQRLLAQRGIRFADFSGALDEPKFYFDTDHLNRAGATEFVGRHLKSLLTGSASP
jgi:hypothetical protein